MKVGLLTYHNTINYGAALQTYASQNIINQLGAECEIIDYVNSQRIQSYSIPALAKSELSKGNIKTAVRMLLGWYLVSKRKSNFVSFYKNNLITSKPYRSHSEIMEEPPIYDRYIVGSDQVWNYQNSGRDTTYFLDFVKDKEKTASYSSSFGLDRIPIELHGVYSDSLARIKSLSVREVAGQRIISELTGREAKLVLDPVFLLDSKKWRDLSAEKFPCRKKFILVYTTKATDFNNFMKITKYDFSAYVTAKISRSTSISDLINPSVAIKYTVTPEEFLSLVDNASLVLTSSFHCTALSIIFQKQFVTFLSDNKGKNTRIESLLNLLGLNDRIFSSNLKPEQIDNPINYLEVNKKLSILKADSIEFLNKVLSDNI
jgi:hypothetical protein